MLNRSLLVAQPVDYTEAYFLLIRQAELNITQLFYSKALVHYQQAFKAVKLPFAVDYYNATLCDIQVKAYGKASQYAGRLLDKGLDSTFFHKSVFTALREQKRWRKLLGTYPKRRQHYLAHLDSALRRELFALLERDQHFRRKPGSYQVYGDSIAEVDKRNVSRVRQILTQYGYPDENLIGIADNNLLGSPLSTVIRHHYQNNNQDLSEILLEQVKRGKLPPREFVQHQEAGNAVTYGQELFTKLDTTVIVEQIFSPQQTQSIDQVRLSVGLETLREWRQKILFELNESLFLPLSQAELVANQSGSFNLQANYGIFTFMGDRDSNKQFLRRVRPESILTKNILDKQGVKQVR